jgi:hypothetical protein
VPDNIALLPLPPYSGDVPPIVEKEVGVARLEPV